MQESAAREEQFRRRAEHERLTREARQQRQQQQVMLHFRMVPQLRMCKTCYSVVQHQQQNMLVYCTAIPHDSQASIDTVPAASRLCWALVVVVCLWRPVV